MAVSTIRMAIPVEKHHEALRILKSIAVHSRNDPGCLGYFIYRDIEDNNVLVAQENWKSENNLDRHIRSDQYRNLLLVLEMSLRRPEVRLDTISHSSGIESIEKIRSTTPAG